MKYWITTHWPCWEGHRGPHLDVWVQDGKDDVIAPLREGDLVFIYELKTGPIELDEDGQPQRRQRGRMGIVALVKAIGAVEDNPELSQYADGKRLWWRWYVPTKPTKYKGFLSRSKLARILGYSPDYTFRGFGTDHSGLMKIDKKTFDKIWAAFISR